MSSLCVYIYIYIYIGMEIGQIGFEPFEIYIQFRFRISQNSNTHFKFGTAKNLFKKKKQFSNLLFPNILTAMATTVTCSLSKTLFFDNKSFFHGPTVRHAPPNPSNPSHRTFSSPCLLLGNKKESSSMKQLVFWRFCRNITGSNNFFSSKLYYMFCSGF